MSTDAFNKWLQLGGNVAILLGLVFVGIQIYQDRQLKSAELIDQFWQSELDRKQLLLGESPHIVIAKAAMKPEDLTHDELYLMSSYFDLALSQWARIVRMEELGLISDRWRKQVEIFGPFHTDVGKRWLEANLGARDLPQALKDQVAQMASDPSFPNELRERIGVLQNES